MKIYVGLLTLLQVVGSWCKGVYVNSASMCMSLCVCVCVCMHVCSFVTGLRDHLLALYSHSSSSSVNTSSSSVPVMTHVHYRSHNYVVEYTPLILAYVILCLYLYFSVREYTNIAHCITVTSTSLLYHRQKQCSRIGSNRVMWVTCRQILP